MKSVAFHLRKWLSPLPIRDPVERRMAALVQVMLLGFIAIILVAAVLNLVLPSSIPWYMMLLRTLVVILIIGIPLMLLRRGHFRSSVLIIISLFCILEAVAVTTAGLRQIAETLLFFTLSMILAGLLLGRRALALTFAFSAGVILFSTLREQDVQARLDNFIIAGNFILLNGLIGLFLDQFGLTLRTALTVSLEHEGELQKEIDQRTQVEEALRASRTKFQGLFDSSPDAIIVADSQGHIVQVNAQVEALFGYRPEELLGRPVETLLPERFHRGHAQHRSGYMAQPRSRIMGMGLDLYGRRKDGSEFVVDINLGTLETEAGPVVLSTVRDITERKRAEEALREKERLFSETQRIGRIGSWSYDIQADTLVFTDELYSLLDISPDEFPHNTEALLGLIHSPDRSMVARWLEDIGVRGQAKDIEFLIFRKNGELRYIRCQGTAEFGPTGKPSRFIGTAQDVTERKLAEIQIRQQLERLLALRKIDQAISSSFDLNVTLDIVTSQMISQLQVDAVAVLLLDTDTNTLHYAAGNGFRTDAISSAPLHMADSQAARERRSIHVQSLKFKLDVRLLTPAGASEGFDCYFGVPLVVKGRVKGVLEVFHRTPLQPYPEWFSFLNTLAGQAAIAIENATLFENLERSNSDLSQAYDATIEGWSRALDLRDKETEGHTRRVTEMTIKLARAFGVPEEDVLHIRRGALLHDIGKMGVPDHILLKPGELTDEEWERMRTHPGYAYDLLKPIAFLKPALDIPYCHHEKWDGTGYPRGLKGQEIPLAARLFSVVDVWDAICSDRPYRPAWTKEKALEHIKSLSGTYFDPNVVEVFLNILKEG